MVRLCLKKNPYIISWDVNWLCHYRNKSTLWLFLKRKKERQRKDKQIQPYDPAAKPFKSVCQRDICTAMIVAALSTVAKKWKQHRRSPIPEWMT